MGTYRIEEVKAPDLYVQPGYEMALKDGESDIPLTSCHKQALMKMQNAISLRSL